MKILLLQDWNPLQGGAETYVVKLRRALTALGDDVRLVTSNVSAAAREVADATAMASTRVVPKAFLQLHNPFAARVVKREVQTFRPDVCLVNMFALYLSPAAVSALGAVPYVLLVSDYKCICPVGTRLLPDDSICPNPVGPLCHRSGCVSSVQWMRERFRYRQIGRVVDGARRIVATSDSVRNTLADHGIAAETLHLFSPEPVSGFRSNPERSPLFLFVGRLDKEKGVDVLLEAFALVRRVLPAARLHVVGRGAQRFSLESLASGLGIADAVVFKGWQSESGIDDELGRAWALIAPSRWREPFGLVALEAILRQVPVVAPDLGGLAEIVQHGAHGLLYPPGDAEVLSRCLLEVAGGVVFPGMRLGDAAVADARKRFSAERHVSRLREIFSEVTEGSGRQVFV